MSVGDPQDGGGAESHLPGNESIGTAFLQQTKHFGCKSVGLGTLTGLTAEGAPFGLCGGDAGADALAQEIPLEFGQGGHE